MAAEHDPTAGERPRRGIELFEASDAEGLFESSTMSFPVFDPDDAAAIGAEQLDLGPLVDGLVDSVLYRGEGAEGFSLVRADVAPHYVLPRHSHDADCLYYVAAGSLTLGARTVRAGSGFFVPAGAPYAYESGPDGAVVLEFRLATSFDMRITGGQMPRFRQMAEAAGAHGEAWQEHRRRVEAGCATPADRDAATR